ncbi:hypothetical protein H2201_004886 [Coniosporium apollinis]|uniref:GST C-terminal domain-containing protein n=1 Tax=Coniosporium apollinis TaxID=61459 RepID=A0ABQ9NTP4_9PEZI|nr:hypothetical protein H2201_004886 [Coniosporium apollinis]
MPDITLYFLQASRCIRTAWLLEELGLDYNVKFWDRENNRAPQEAKVASGNPLGKYLCENYDKSHRLIPTSQPHRIRVQQWLHAAEATFLLHALAITYVRWNAPKNVHESGDVETMEKGMSANVQNDLNWLESELEKGEGRFLVGNEVTAADVMMMFSVDFILARGLGTKGCDDKWPKTREWLGVCKETVAYRRAVGKTGYKL